MAGTLITDDQDDRAYHHSLGLRPVGGATGVKYGVLEAGHYVFVREENRHKDTNWSDIVLDNDLSRLVYKRCTKDKDDKRDMSIEYSDDCYFRDSTYIVLEINTAPSALEKETQQLLYSELQNALTGKASPIFKESLPADALTALAARINQKALAKKLLSELDILDRSDAKDWERKTARERFISKWFVADPAAPGNAVTPEDREHIERRVSSLLAKCGSLSEERLLEVMNAIGNRTADESMKEKISSGLRCG